MSRCLLQIALDAPDEEVAADILAAVATYADLIEIGTPLLLEGGLGVLRRARERYPALAFVADCKIADADRVEADSAFRAGASVVTGSWPVRR